LQSIGLESKQLEPYKHEDPKSLWAAVLGNLQLHVSRDCFDTWLSKTSFLSLEEDILTIGAPNAFVAEMLEQRLSGIVLNYVQKLAGSELSLRVEVVGAASAPIPEVITHKDDLVTSKGFSGRLFHKFTFSDFVVGPSNELAHAAAMAVATSPADKYNPLVIYSSVGLGKTHLLHAIGHNITALGMSPVYVTTEEFTNQYISAIRAGTTEEFRFQYRHADVLLIDDIQFLSGKEQTQEGFFHTFNALHLAGKQIVVASDRPIQELSILEKRITSRLAGGLVVDLQPPSRETRVAILQSKLNRLNKSDFVSGDMLDLIASRAPTNIRELEGCLNRIVAYADLVNHEINLDIVSQLIPDTIDPQAHLTVTAKMVLDLISKHFNIENAALCGRTRSSQLTNARHMAMYLLRHEAKMGFKEIGKSLGDRDHSTVINACHKIDSMISRSASFQNRVQFLRKSLR